MSQRIGIIIDSEKKTLTVVATGQTPKVYHNVEYIAVNSDSASPLVWDYTKPPAPKISRSGTSLRGYIDIPYHNLAEKLGPPDENGDGYKVDAEWVREDEEGTVFTIYNYKTGRNYLGEDGLAVEDIRDWHIGGFSSAARRAVEKLFPNFVVREG